MQSVNVILFVKMSVVLLTVELCPNIYESSFMQYALPFSDVAFYGVEDLEKIRAIELCRFVYINVPEN